MRAAHLQSDRAARQQRQQASKGKQRAAPASAASGPPAKKARRDTAGISAVASVALVRAEDGHVLLTRELRGGKTLLNLPGGKGEAGETLGQTAAREAHEETGGQLTQRTRDAIAAITEWTACSDNQGHVGVLRLAAGDRDTRVHERFDRTAANSNRVSKTVQVGLEWHPLASVSSHEWRKAHMHYPGQHRAEAAARALGGSGGAGGACASSGSAAASALNLGDSVQEG